MIPAQPDSKLDTTPASRGLGPTPTAGAVNYGHLHRGTVVIAAPSGAMVRLEVYQRRGLERLSLAN